MVEILDAKALHFQNKIVHKYTQLFLDNGLIFFTCNPGIISLNVSEKNPHSPFQNALEQQIWHAHWLRIWQVPCRYQILVNASVWYSQHIMCLPQFCLCCLRASKLWLRSSSVDEKNSNVKAVAFNRFALEQLSLVSTYMNFCRVVLLNARSNTSTISAYFSFLHSRGKVSLYWFCLCYKHQVVTEAFFSNQGEEAWKNWMRVYVRQVLP